MKTRFAILFFSVLFFSVERLNSQSINNNVPELPLKSTNSVLFGKDIIINNNPSRDQRLVSLCSAYNGWLFAAYTYPNAVPSQGFPGLITLKSEDNGLTWTVLFDIYFDDNSYITSLNILALGDSIDNLKLFMVFTATDDETTQIGEMYWVRYFAESGTYIDGGLIDNFIYYSAISSDFIYPAENSNPYSVGIISSRHYSAGDSIIFRSSSNGGFTWDRKAIAGTTNHFRKVALTYGRSLSQNNGRYFAAWEEKADFTTSIGHIYTAHSEPYFNSSWTAKLMLDSLNSTIYNNVKNPAIACQYNNIDNDSTSFTEVVLFDTYNSATSKYDINGFYNMRPANTDHFNLFTPNLAIGDNRQEASINFNPFDSTFMLTYYDVTNQKLPFVTHNFNMINADSWQIVNSGYNDSTNLANPNPRVALNYSEEKGACVWVAEGNNGNGIAMFDAPYSTYTGISGNNTNNNDRLFGAYPNPCKDFTNISFELKSAENVKIILYDLYGRSVGKLTDQYFRSGKHDLRYDVSGFPSGTYIYKFQTAGTTLTGRLIVFR